MNNQTGEKDEVRLASKDLEQILNVAISTGNLNLNELDLLNMDPQLVQQLQRMQTTAVQPSEINSVRPRPRPVAGRQGSRQLPSGPWVEIAEEPKARGLRFRYECEGRSAGSIPGESSTSEKKTYPTIKIHNYSGPAVIVVSCVTRDEPYKPHPHNLVGKDCKKGVCTLKIRDTSTVSFPHLGIQCAKKKDVEGNLKMRQEINVDPYQTGFKHKSQSIDLNVVRLCFQVFLPDETGKITRIVPPVVSQAIYDKKALNDLIICRVDRTSGKPKGGDEVFLLCEKINRDDIRVRFYEEKDGIIVWEAFGDFGQNDVHRQFAIVFKTPPYRDTFLTRPVDVSMQLQRTSDLEGSDPIQFTYQPEDPDPDRILEKRKRKAASLNFLTDQGTGNISQEQLKHRLKLKATRTNPGRVKHELIPKEEAIPELPSNNMYTLNQMPVSTVNNSMMGVSYSLANQMDLTSSVASQATMSGGKVQYTIPMTTVQQQPQVPLTPQLLQLICNGLNFQGAPPASPQQQFSSHTLQPGSDQSMNQQQNEILSQLVNALSAQGQQSMVPPNQSGDNSAVSMNVDTSLMSQPQEHSLNSLLTQDLLSNLMHGESPMVSFGSLDMNLECEQNVAGFETVGEDSNLSSSQPQQHYDEASTAVQHLN